MFSCILISYIKKCILFIYLNTGLRGPKWRKNYALNVEKQSTGCDKQCITISDRKASCMSGKISVGEEGQSGRMGQHLSELVKHWKRISQFIFINIVLVFVTKTKKVHLPQRCHFNQSHVSLTITDHNTNHDLSLNSAQHILIPQPLNRWTASNYQNSISISVLDVTLLRLYT